MIVGVGIDLVDQARLARLLERRPRFIERVLTPAERAALPAEGRRRLEFVSGRFAAKEALAKALGTGIGGRFSFQDISLLPGPGGRPAVRVEGDRLKAALGAPGDVRIHVAISHERSHTVAVAIVERWSSAPRLDIDMG
ncbi:holo-ACP synthase [Hydrogenibacillus sp. N12]|uniref:holo-ACP synthase n=1 Tax=Hydrogenibacillus sp. N12 TaxID=2866627 RepID=UPI001C7DB222|nr:holo-ACP synthase [Hydrogenibacillus sp. N12]QZA32842.1 holo-ACP synthase [Hydrogenibacillus sp. N12]